MRLTALRLLAYGIDVLLLAAVLLPVSFVIGSVLGTDLKLAPWELVHLAFFGLAPRLGAFEGPQIVVVGAAYALMLAYVVVALLNGGRRSVPDFVAGTTVDGVGRE